MKIIDLRSDTVTRPTPAMLEAMTKAPLGDDVYGDDPTVNQLEETGANMLGKEAALFVPTGTMGNLIAAMTHTTPGHEIILGNQSHMFYCEVANLARVAGVQTRTLPCPKGQISLQILEESIRTDNIHFPETGLICMENTHNLTGGAVLPLSYMEKVYQLAQSTEIPVHLDGARVFNAAASLKVDVRQITRYADSVMCCLSKGLCAPVGSLLCGSQAFIHRARKIRKMLGGGMRQAGVLAACGLISLTDMTKRLEEDHENARFLAEELLKTHYFITQPEGVKTNIVNAVLDHTSANALQLVDIIAENGVLANARSKRHFRFVTHHDVSREEISEAVRIIDSVIRSL